MGSPLYERSKKWFNCYCVFGFGTYRAGEPCKLCFHKGGNLAFSRALAMELAPGISVSIVSPPVRMIRLCLQSDVAKEARDRGTTYEEVKHEFEQQGVMGQWANAEEMAYGIFLVCFR